MQVVKCKKKRAGYLQANFNTSVALICQVHLLMIVILQEHVYGQVCYVFTLVNLA